MKPLLSPVSLGLLTASSPLERNVPLVANGRKIQGCAHTTSVASHARTADCVTGSYDVIGVVEAEDLNAVGDLVTGQIQTLDGIVCTMTCPCWEGL